MGLLNNATPNGGVVSPAPTVNKEVMAKNHHFLLRESAGGQGWTLGLFETREALLEEVKKNFPASIYELFKTNNVTVYRNHIVSIYACRCLGGLSAHK